jgi:ribonucleoside-triphosphate reductase
LNEFLRLCGVGLTGIVEWMDGHDFYQGSGTIKGVLFALREGSHAAIRDMADELGTPRAKAVTTVKPSGTLSKVMDTTEGAHRPLGKYIINNIRFSKNDPLVPVLRDANYRVIDDPYASDGSVVAVPVAYENVKFEEVDGVLVNRETAIQQLERYKLLMENYVDHNCSITISYSPYEVNDIVEWLYENWDSYVGVSWLLRADPTQTAEDLGYPYLPQEVVTKEQYDAYVAQLKPVNIDEANAENALVDDECATGMCPVR